MKNIRFVKLLKKLYETFVLSFLKSNFINKLYISIILNYCLLACFSFLSIFDIISVLNINIL